MSKENLEQFMKQVVESEDLQASAELSDAELEGVSGGVRVLRFRLFRLFSTVFPAALHLWTSSVWVVMPRPAPVKLK